MKTKSALSYFGSDSERTGAIAHRFDRCKHVTIPFVGGASIIPCLKAKAIVANDLNTLAINYYRVASGCYGQGPRDRLFERCATTLSHPDEMALAEQYLATPDNAPPSRQAWAYWCLCWVGRKGKGGTNTFGVQPSARFTADGGNNATRLQTVIHDLTAWAVEFQRCEWLCLDFRKLLPKVADTAMCGVYADPPWVGAGAGYFHPFAEQDHVDLRDALTRFENTTVLVRYDDHPLIHDLYKGWHFTTTQARNQANGQTGEVWITNNPYRCGCGRVQTVNRATGQFVGVCDTCIPF